MKLVTTALEWSYQAGTTEVSAERLQSAASLLVLRRDTLRMIDGAGPNVEVPPSESATEVRVNGMEAQHVSSRGDLPEKETQARTARPEMVEQASSAQNAPATSRDAVGDSARPAKATKCTFSGVVPIELQQFLDSGIRLVECPDCAATRSLEPHRGVLCFSSHDKRKMRTSTTSRRWARIDSTWKVVGS